MRQSQLTVDRVPSRQALPPLCSASSGSSDLTVGSGEPYVPSLGTWSPGGKRLCFDRCWVSGAYSIILSAEGASEPLMSSQMESLETQNTLCGAGLE